MAGWSVLGWLWLSLAAAPTGTNGLSLNLAPGQVQRDRIAESHSRPAAEPSSKSERPGASRLARDRLDAPRPSATQLEAARQRRLRFVIILSGALAAFLGTAGFLLIRRGRKRSQPQTPQASLRIEVATTKSHPTHSMQCPTCKLEYPSQLQFCLKDGNRLVDMTSDALAMTSASGGICPVCGHGYNPGVTTCARDGEELIPVVLAQRNKLPDEAPHKVCPNCGLRYPDGAEFCGIDGSGLVPMN